MPEVPYKIGHHLHILQDEAMQPTVLVMDERGAGGAHHKYAITYGATESGDEMQIIHFQNGPMQTVDQANGITHESLLGIVAHRLECFQAGPYACQENADALTLIYATMDVLHQRTSKRLERGVEGTHTV